MATPDDGRKRTWRFKLNDTTTLEVSAKEPATERQVRRRGRWSLILGTLIAAAALTTVALAGHAVNPTSLTFNATEGGANPASQTFTFSGPAACTGGTISDNGAWLTLNKSTIVDDDAATGDVQTTVTASVNVTGLTAARSPYAATVTINPTDSNPSANEPCDSNLTVAVTLNVTAGDTTAPDSASVLIDDGAAWTNDASGNVSVDISAHDAVGVVRYRLATSQVGLDSASDVAVSPAVNFSASNLPFTLSAGEGASKAVWARFCDAAVNCTDASDTIGWDHTAPTITNDGPTPALPNGSNGWYVTAVSNQFSASDGTSGLSAACDLAFPKSVSTGTTESNAVTVSSGTCSDIAGNINSGINSDAFKIDLTNPSVAITSPSTAITTIATSITVSGTASDTPSGLASVSVNGTASTLSAGTFLALNVVLNCGANTFTALATDNAGRTATTTTSISVTRLCFGLQYLQPIDQSTSTAVVNTGKYGRVIPVKVILSLLGGGALSEADLVSSGLTLEIGVNSVACTGGTATDSVEAYADAGASAGGTNDFRWDPTASHWIYNLDTKAPPGVAMAINSCYRLDAYVSDGTNKVKVSTTTYAIFKPVK